MPFSHSRYRKRHRLRHQCFEPLEARRVLDSTVVFNELMYNPIGGEESLEWIELHNQMAVDMNLSGWSLQEAVDFSFPQGTILGGGEYLVVAASPERLQAEVGFGDAMGPFTRQLANSGDRVELRNHTGRLMDLLEYDDGNRWTAVPDGAGASLAKIEPQSATDAPENWTFSSQRHGTPGASNLTVDHPTRDRLQINEVAAAGDESLWIELHNKSDEPLSLARHFLGRQRPSPAIHRFTQETLPADGYLVVSAEELRFDLVEGDRIALYAADGQLLVDAIEVSARLQGRSAEHAGRWQFPSEATPGSANRFAFHDQIVINEIMYHARPEYSTPAVFVTDPVMDIDASWRFDQSGEDRGTQWREPGFDDSQWDVGQGLFFNESSDLAGLPKNTPLEIGAMTYYFRTTFEWDDVGDGTSLGLRHVVDDGAVFYINGVEFARFNMPTGEIDFQTRSRRSVSNAAFVGPLAIPADLLQPGTNTLAVEVHQRNATSNDVVFGADLGISRQTVPATPFEESGEEWIELYNRGDQAVDLSGWRLGEAVQFDFPAGTMVGPDEYVVVARDAAQLASSHPGINIVGEFAGRLSDRDERVRLVDANDNLADQLHYFDGGRWPEYADGGGASLELRDPDADNSRGEAWSNSRETGRSTWNHYSYTATVNPVVFDPPINFHEFVMGLIGPGEVWLDNISVVEDPEADANQLIQNGSFQADTPGEHAEKWRLVGTHETSEVIVDPDQADNQVLRLVAEARMNYLSNHAETTLANDARVVDGRTYQISFDAKWIAGTPQLHTELYYKDAAKTTILAQPDIAGTPGTRNSTWQQNVGPTYDGMRHDPPIPSASDPVTVTVTTNDPDGVAEVELRYAVDGADQFTTVPMTFTSNSTYVATIPPQSNRDVVQFYVQATDGQGAVSMFPAAGPESRALYKVTNNLNLDGPRHDFRLIMTRDDSRELHNRTNMVDNNRQGSTVIYNGTEIFYDVGTRLKGSMFSRQDTSRTGYNVRFHPDQKFRGVHETVRFDQNGESEILVKYFAAAIGNLGGSYDDVFQLTTPSGQGGGPTLTFLAAHDDVFLREQFENGQEGTLFKFEGIRVMQTTVDRNPESLKLYQPIGWVSQFDIQDLGNDKELYRWPYLIHNNRDRDDFDPIVALAKTFSLEGKALEQAAAELLDIEQWMSTFAIMSLFGIGDAYSQGNPHNLNIYQRPSDGKLLAFPWDWDFVFSQAPTAPLHGNKNMGKLIDLPPFEHMFLGQLHHMISTQFNRATMEHWTRNFDSLLGGIRGLVNSIDRRGSFVLGRLPAEVFFQIGTDESNVMTTELVNASSQARVLVPSTDNGGDQLGDTWTTMDFVPSDDWQSGPAAIGFEASPDDFEDLIKQDVSSMYTNNSTAYIRVPFQWDGDPATADRLRLRMKYDDGFIAYLNGQKIAEANAPSTPQWDSIASASHRDNEAVEFADFNVGAHLSALRTGDNVLAIHGLNRSASGNDFLIVPELIVQDLEEGVVKEMTVDTSSVTLDGKGWINVRHIQLEGAEQPLELEWTDTTTWRTTVPLQPGLNPLALQAIDFSGNVIAADRINVTSTVVRPILDHLRVSEVMYHSTDPTLAEQAAGFDDDDDFDFIELVNTSLTQTLDLTDVRLDNGVQFRFPATQLAPQQRVVVAANLQAFGQRYGQRDDVLGSYTGRLSNGGEELSLLDAAGTVILDINYSDDDPWPVRADGIGASLELIDPAATPVEQYDRAGRWRGSVQFGGSPGREGLAPVGIVINEVLANTDPTSMLTDSIELYNTTDQTIDLSGWWLSDSSNRFAKYSIVAGTQLSAGDYLVLDETHFNPTPASPGPNDFALNGARGDDVWLVQPGPNQAVAAFVDNVQFGASANGISFGRLPNGQGRLLPLVERTFGRPNSEPQIGPVVISEFQYHPSVASDAALQIDPNMTNDDLEFLELHNASDETVDLRGWSLLGGVEFQFDQSVELPAGGTLLIVPFAPDSVQNASRLEAFRTHYGLDESVPIVGGYDGQLRDRGELLQWKRPDLTADVSPESAPKVIADEVLYDHLDPWPTTASGTGNSLQRISATANGNLAASWQAASPSPGQLDAAGDLNGDGRVDAVDIDLICAAIMGQDPPDSDFDLNGDNTVDLQDHDHLVRSAIGTSFGDANVDGVFDSSDLVLVFRNGHYDDDLQGNSGWADGDWNCDGEFNSTDIVFAFRQGAYVSGAVEANDVMFQKDRRG